jgi:site-specific DNA recombinase
LTFPGRILANRVHLGEVHFRDIVATDAHPALIDDATLAAAQRLRDARGDKQTQRAGSDSDSHCTGLITCPRCGHKYVGTSARGKTRRYRYYTCFSRTRYGTAGCPAGRIDADALDTAVLTAIAHTFTSRTDLLTHVVTRARQHHHDSHAHRHAQLTTVEAEIASARAAIDRYLTAFENGTVNDTTCAPRVAALETKIIQLEAHQAELIDILSAEPTTPSADILNALRRRIRDVIAVGTPAQRKELIKAMVAEIRIDGDTVYPIFLLPKTTKPPPTRSRRANKSHRFAQWCGWWARTKKMRNQT